MTTEQRLREIISELSEERLRQLLEFAEFLDSSDESEAWNRFGLAQFAKLYEADEADYDGVPLKPWR